MKINNLKAVDLCNKTGINKVKMSLQEEEEKKFRKIPEQQRVSFGV